LERQAVLPVVLVPPVALVRTVTRERPEATERVLLLILLGFLPTFLAAPSVAVVDFAFFFPLRDGGEYVNVG
jgi:hypothetical protein